MTTRRINGSIKRIAMAGGLAALVAACASAAGAPTTPATSIVPSPSSVAAMPTTAPTPTATATPGLEASLDELFGMLDLNGSVLVSKDGEILYAKGFGMADDAAKLANTPMTRFRIASLTKQFTAMAILILESRGIVNRSDSICDYIDKCPKGWKAVTIEHLVVHTSGIADFTEQPDFDSMKAATPAETVASVAAIPLQWAPGEIFGYTNTGYVLLGMTGALLPKRRCSATDHHSGHQASHWRRIHVIRVLF